ncbi:MAG TPA: neutral/alkaline non-lysosomal ceramidase N-terminal domain-containing protein [Candidatus Saccharimonadales bacterium]|nr:neutral/alkaline non-lysosomal ceramidase N-terminal domain-containing protein [Candidatus Saccharimonadales bacterium]
MIRGGVLVCLCLALGCRSMSPGGCSGGPLQIGAAEVDITPPVGFRMAGYFDERISTGIHDPLHAKAIVLQQGHTEIALVFCDLIGLSLHVTTRARALAARQTGIPVTNIVISATHTHTGPLFDDVRLDYLHQAAMAREGVDPHETMDYPAFLTAQLVEVIVAAQTARHPGRLEAGVTQQPGMTFNRRYWMKNGKVVTNPGQLNPNTVRPAGPSDPDVDILLARDTANGPPFAGVTLFAMHSDTTGGTKFSADYEYSVERTLQEAFGTNFISAFGLGACGDLNHINVNKKEPTGGFEVAARLGRTLGQTVLDAVPHLAEVARPELAARSMTLRAPLQDVSPEQLAEARALTNRLGDAKVNFLKRVDAVRTLDLAQRGSSWPMEVQVIRLDNETALVCLPGEIFTGLGLAIKHASPFPRTMVLTLANDRPSYVPTRQAFAEGSYEVSNSRVKPGVGETLVSTALRELNDLRH